MSNLFRLSIFSFLVIKFYFLFFQNKRSWYISFRLNREGFYMVFFGFSFCVLIPEKKNVFFPYQAINANVILKEIELKNETTAGLDISSSADKNQKFRKGKIVSLGHLCPDNPKTKEPILKVGDEILFDAYKGSELTIDAEVYKVIYFADVTVVL